MRSCIENVCRGWLFILKENLINYTLPKYLWGKSFLHGQAIQMYGIYDNP